MRYIKVFILMFLYVFCLSVTSLKADNLTKRGGTIYLRDGNIIEAPTIYLFGVNKSEIIKCKYGIQNIEINISNLKEIEFLEYFDRIDPKTVTSNVKLRITRKDGKNFDVEKADLQYWIDYDFYDVVNDKVSTDKISTQKILKIIFDTKETKKSSPTSMLSGDDPPGEEVSTIGNLTIVPFDPGKETNVARERTEWAARKIAEIAVKKGIGEVTSVFAGNVFSKIFGIVTAVISQMPSVGNPTELECYFVFKDDIMKKGELYSKGTSSISYYQVGILVYLLPGDLLSGLDIELDRKLNIIVKNIYSEKIPPSFFENHYSHMLITISKPIILKESGEYVLTAKYGSEERTAFLSVK